MPCALAQRGQTLKALGTGMMASFSGGMIALRILILFARTVPGIAFGPHEHTSLSALAMVGIISGDRAKTAVHEVASISTYSADLGALPGARAGCIDSRRGLRGGTSLFCPVVMLMIGVLGYFVEQPRLPLAPVVLGFAMGPLPKENPWHALLLTDGDMNFFVQRPYSAAFSNFLLLIIAISLSRHRKNQNSSRRD